MLYWALTSLAAALTAGLLGFGGLASALAGPAQLLFFVFLMVSAVIVAIELSSDH